MQAAYSAGDDTWIPSQHLLNAAERSEYARYAAALLDLGIVIVLQFLTGQIVGVFRSHEPDVSFANGLGVQMYIHKVPAAPLPWLIVVGVAYFVPFEALFAATPGKALMRLRVVALDGTRPSLRAILVRNVLRPVDAWPMFYIAAAAYARFYRRPQRLGDAAAGTFVISVADLPAGFRAIRHPWRAALALTTLVLLLAALGATYIYVARPPLVVEGWKNLNNQYSFVNVTPTTDSTQTPDISLPCGLWTTAYSGDVVVGDVLTSYTLGDPQHTGDTLVYPFTFTTAHSRQRWHGTITLRWMGWLNGGWVVVGGATTC